MGSCLWEATETCCCAETYEILSYQWCQDFDSARKIDWKGAVSLDCRNQRPDQWFSASKNWHSLALACNVTSRCFSRSSLEMLVYFIQRSFIDLLCDFFFQWKNCSQTSKRFTSFYCFNLHSATHFDLKCKNTTECETAFKPNVIFIRLFLYKKHWITGKNKPKTQKHASIYSMARDRKEKLGVLPPFVF